MSDDERKDVSQISRTRGILIDLDVFFRSTTDRQSWFGAGPLVVKVRPACSEGLNARWLSRTARGREVEKRCILDNKEE